MVTMTFQPWHGIARVSMPLLQSQFSQKLMKIWIDCQTSTKVAKSLKMVKKVNYRSEASTMVMRPHSFASLKMILLLYWTAAQSALLYSRPIGKQNRLHESGAHNHSIGLRSVRQQTAIIQLCMRKFLNRCKLEIVLLGAVHMLHNQRLTNRIYPLLLLCSDL